MRIGALLLVGLGLVSVAACTATTSADEVCISGGGVCVDTTDQAGCGEFISGLACDTGQVCCTPSAAYGADGGTTPTSTSTSSSAASSSSSATVADAATSG